MKKGIAVLLSLLLLFTACAAGAEEDAESLCKKGREALDAGDYTTSFELFTRLGELGDSRGVTNALKTLCMLSSSVGLPLLLEAFEQGIKKLLENR